MALTVVILGYYSRPRITKSANFLGFFRGCPQTGGWNSGVTILLVSLSGSLPNYDYSKVHMWSARHMDLRQELSDQHRGEPKEKKNSKTIGESRISRQQPESYELTISLRPDTSRDIHPLQSENCRHAQCATLTDDAYLTVLDAHCLKKKKIATTKHITNSDLYSGDTQTPLQQMGISIATGPFFNFSLCIGQNIFFEDPTQPCRQYTLRNTLGCRSTHVVPTFIA